MGRLTSWLRLWFTFERRVGRREYIATGLALAPLKYIVDVLLVWLGTSRFWTPLDYVHPVEILMRYPSPRAATWLVPVLGLWALPFLWIGISMSMRRAPWPRNDRARTSTACRGHCSPWRPARRSAWVRLRSACSRFAATASSSFSARHL